VCGRGRRSGMKLQQMGTSSEISFSHWFKKAPPYSTANRQMIIYIIYQTGPSLFPERAILN